MWTGRFQFSNPRAKWIAESTACIFENPRLVMYRCSKFLGIVVMLSRFAAQFLGRPSSGPKGTSAGIALTRLETGATVTKLRWT